MFHTMKEIGEPQHSGVAHQMLVSIHQHLSRPGVWTKGTPGPGMDCFSTAIDRERLKRGMNQHVSDILHRHVMKAIFAYRDSGIAASSEITANWIPVWNDVPSRTLRDILEVLTIAAMTAHEIEAEIVAQIGAPSSDQRDMRMTAASKVSIEALCSLVPSPSIVYGCGTITFDYKPPTAGYAQLFVEELTQHAW